MRRRRKPEYLIEFDSNETDNIDSDNLSRFIEQAALVAHLACFLKLLSDEYPDCDVGFWFRHFEKDPALHSYNVCLSLKEEPDIGDATVLDLRINPFTWTIQVHTGDSKWDGRNLRDVVSLNAYTGENENRRLLVDPDNYRLLDTSAKCAGVPITEQMNKLLFWALQRDGEIRRNCLGED